MEILSLLFVLAALSLGGSKMYAIDRAHGERLKDDYLEHFHVPLEKAKPCCGDSPRGRTGADGHRPFTRQTNPVFC